MNIRGLLHNLLDRLYNDNPLDKPACVRIVKRDDNGCAVSECYIPINYVMMNGSFCIEHDEIKDWTKVV